MPDPGRPQPTTQQLIDEMRRLPRLDAAELRAEADEFFGDRIDDDPFDRT
ncbi:hypothetical protein [Kribbella antibiotica]|nr:hypothetical protein [Kribbella antibiotica]